MALPNSIESNSRLDGPTHLARRPLAGAVFGFQFMERLTDLLLAHQGRGVLLVCIASFPVAPLVDASDARLHGETETATPWLSD